ncbi:MULTISPECIES: ABC transporter ATP-binding protein [unclassified Rathayibacter]|jgi:ABC-2 type transport system ATP-binding protein|uniref:ABC transporter ATP-binding protein n=1 Tax=unclassified Rathayibacter TaxID=2609250 RepID=UPI000CE79267|nr:MULTISPECIES: ATP-binding cassette domain-containing protein [unclassified Rathayibacter]PPG51574.1 multidrug ABC transporter ATP-binding protein [Rathayibacter sp. AY2B3]PPI22708.1 multidrug ABC transporter ATP-binding protein [Rathayibacter sp. AY1B6]PPI26396.1 multidrug ABC transporter ATP-binding protein [Rathayibacter sp. AY1B5]PPI38197.1 multidrug ABC transporter ATP-binding protein [Rathayibacter sp. AY1B1]
MIEARGLTKRFGAKTAVDAIDFTVEPGRVTGFLGPNGAGKSTTMRMIVGLDRPTSGSVRVNGRPYAEHSAPLREVGALLDAKAAHRGRSVRDHLRVIAATHRIPRARVEEVIELVGLQSVARKRVGGFSLGMGQRVGIATALLGDPRTLLLDEPVNGLDPEGVRWVRDFVRGQAAEGRCVLLSSHLMSEMAQTADHIIVLGRGRILADAPLADFLAEARPRVRVASPEADRLAELLAGGGARVARTEGGLEVEGLDASAIGELSLRGGIVLHALTPLTRSLEDAYTAMTADAVEYATATASATEGAVR